MEVFIKSLKKDVKREMNRKFNDLNSTSDRPSKKARVDSDHSAEVPILDPGQEAASTSSDMRQSSRETKEPQRAQDWGGLGEASISNPEQKGTTNSLSFYHLNTEEAGSPDSETFPLKSAHGRHSEPYPPALFRTLASTPTLKTPLPRFRHAPPIPQLPGLVSPSPTPAVPWERHGIFCDDDRNHGNCDMTDPATSNTSSVANGSSTSTAQATTSMTTSLTEHSQSSHSQVLSSSGGAITALQSSRVPFNSATLASPGDTEDSSAANTGNFDNSAAAVDASRADAWASIAPTNMAGMANTSTDVELVGSLNVQKRSSITTNSPSICVAGNVSQPPTLRPAPSPLWCSINHPVVQTTPIHPNLPVSQVASTMETLIHPIFPLHNFAPIEDGDLEKYRLEEYPHQNQSETVMEDILELRKQGFVYLEDQLIGSKVSQYGYFWSSQSWEILISILTKPRIRRILSDWFQGPCLVGHWLEWPTKSTPMVFARNEVESLANSEFDIPYLGLHVMFEATDTRQAGSVKCYARSHRKAWQAEFGTNFTNSQEALRNHDSEKLSNGL